jgi:hypothetical protein
VSVVKQSQQLFNTHIGYRLTVQYRVVTNTVARYQLTPTATKNNKGLLFEVMPVLAGEEIQLLPEGPTVVSVNYMMRIGGFGGPVDDDKPEVRAAEPAERAAAPAEGARRLAGGGRVLGEKIPAGLELNPDLLKVNLPVELVRPSDFTFGLEVAMENDPTVNGRAIFNFSLS